MILWNIAWRRPRSAAGRIIRGLIAEQDADLVCLTETDEGFLGSGGHTIASAADYGYRAPAGRRKVILWSRSGWTDVDPLGDARLPTGRYVAGRTSTPLGGILAIGACIPWQRAHVSTGRRDRRPWQDHETYLDGLSRILAALPPGVPTVLLGDFNQCIPRVRAPEAMYRRLMTALPPAMTVATAGPMPGAAAPSIDHLAHTPDLAAAPAAVLPAEVEGVRLSDHFGLCLELRRA